MDIRERVESNGFATVPDVLPQKEAVRLIGELSRAAVLRSRAGIRHAMKIPFVCNLANHEQLLAIAKEILGPEAIPFRATLFDKTPTANWLVVWHQDTDLPLKWRRETPGWGPWSVKDGIVYAHAPADALSQALVLRGHLDDSTSENGPLRVLPGTHKLGVLTDVAIHELSTKIAVTECTPARGGVLAMRPLIVHASSKSRSENPRRVLHIEYGASPLFAHGLELAVT